MLLQHSHAYYGTDLKQGGRGRGGFGRGGGGPHRGQRERTNKVDIDRHNEKYEKYYNELGIVPRDKQEEFWEAFRRDLPNSFRFTGSKVWVKHCFQSTLN
jgi:multisite-specific tRNA:(cytosine-C5)-methyltransferase